MIAIRTIDLEKKHNEKVVVNKLNLSIEEGELFSLLGTNGAGKTTTIKILSCLCSPTSGDAILLGDSIVKNSFAVKEKIGVSPQETAVGTARELMEGVNAQNFEDAFIALSTDGGVFI
ncbi:MAG: ATP-binding cassette domain-containing protein [Epulopiscium sp.]|nr:ATP-binding cassette domain-containing protein [Candidatus Epulonipiscium sp.]